MKQLFSNADDQDVFNFVKGKLENNCDRDNANIAIERLSEWKARPLDDEAQSAIVKDLERDVNSLESQIKEATTILESEDESLEHKITVALGALA